MTNHKMVRKTQVWAAVWERKKDHGWQEGASTCRLSREQGRHPKGFPILPRSSPDIPQAGPRGKRYNQ